MDKDDYIGKSNNLFKDEKVYKKLNTNPINSIQNKVNKQVKNLFDKGFIDEVKRKSLTIYNSTLSKAYCLPKIHKEGCPMRPIISSVGAATYDLAKYINEILKISFENRTDYNVKNVFDFVDNLRGYNLKKGYVLISLDVVSLFTNISISLVKSILTERFEYIDEVVFFETLSIVADNTVFTFDMNIYKQTFGVPMGSPISPILALITMDYILDKVIPTLGYHLDFIKKYVDDIILAVPADKVDDILTKFNNYNSNIQFTIERENEGGWVPFLDTKVIRNKDNVIEFDWYTKAHLPDKLSRG
ncbi:uncharacterized protein [Onthophagus taurus]|uniref:uncharacterized protein n=1 Tax=Onthophagus taurus TaxID=166361 RepID=UPI0039BE65C4